MYARIINANVQPDKISEFLTTFSEQVLPDASRENGFKGIYLMRDAAQNKIMAVVLWETEADAEASIEGFMRRRFPKVAPFLAGPPATQTLEVVLRA